tara:strand:- start:2329 stop:3639 length:1311 start_codon:yes stop_codon:yes gene_type:complete
MAKFKKHMMYSKSGESKMANTYEEHLALKKKGWGHTKPKPKNKKGEKNVPQYGLGGLFSSLFGGGKRKGQEMAAEADAELGSFASAGWDANTDAVKALNQLSISPSQTAIEAREKGIGHFYDGIEPPEVDTEAFEKGEESRKATQATTTQQVGRMSPEAAQGMLGRLNQQSIEGDIKAEENMSKLQSEADQRKYDQAMKIAGAEAEFDKAMVDTISKQEYEADKHKADLGADYLQGLADSKAAGEQLELESKQNLWGNIGDTIGGFFGLGEDGMFLDEEIIQQNNNNMEEMQMQPGEPEVSPGEENHDTNPIDLVQNGEKIGELTGGEFIVPSKDADMIAAFLEEGNTQDLFKLLMELVTKWKKKAAEDEEKMAEVLEPQGAPQGGPMMPPGMMPPGGPMGGPAGGPMPGQPMPEELAALTGAMNMAAAGAYLKKQ